MELLQYIVHLSSTIPEIEEILLGEAAYEVFQKQLTARTNLTKKDSFVWLVNGVPVQLSPQRGMCEVAVVYRTTVMSDARYMMREYLQ